MLYELDNLQNQVEKAQLSSNRFQTEREDYQMDAERQREKVDKLQVGTVYSQAWNMVFFKRCINVTYEYCTSNSYFVTVSLCLELSSK